MKQERQVTIDENQTKKRMRSLLDGRYRKYLETLPSYIEPRIGSGYSLVPPDFNNTSHQSATENVAVERVLYEQERNRFINAVFESIQSLNDTEKYIVVYRYLQHEIKSDIVLTMELALSRSSYNRIKGSGLLKMAYQLGVEVYCPMDREGEA